MAIVGDVRYAVRSLGRSPGFAVMVVVVAMLSLAIGANTVVFSIRQPCRSRHRSAFRVR